MTINIVFNRSQKMVKRLESLPKDRWLYYWDKFNGWEFPVDFYDLIPVWWRRNSSSKRAFDLIQPIMDRISIDFSQKDKLNYGNVRHGRMTQDEFEFWFDNVSGMSHKANTEKYHDYYERSQKIKTLRWWEDDVFERIFPKNTTTTQTAASEQDS